MNVRIGPEELGRLWPGWSVSTYRDRLSERLVVNLSVGEVELLQECRQARDAAARLFEGASVKELAKRIVSHQRCMGLRRYGRKRR